DRPEGDTPGYSPHALLMRKSFDQWSEDDLTALEEVLARLAVKLATRRSRRLVPAIGSGQVDLRRSFRRLVSTGGELLSLARRSRPIERTRLVVLCDTSGSMDPHTRFLLAFTLSLRRVVKDLEVFVFNTRLTRLTPWLSRRHLRAVLDRVAAEVPDWSGGTRIGECLEAFVRGYLTSMVTSRTVVVILSDGLDRGEPELLRQAMRAIHGASRRVIWLNPLMGDPRYEPTARGMQVALPYVDRLVPAHSLESLERMVSTLSA
ncbi:MAG TPA: VWA domain-containing protein, partial [Gemmatimonadales bacterium]|nr:VWA domain-containing protein [Gemmatimonadales bacterium]